ncbi:hypothetical protein GH714_014154 [Hevea brasiliensis]|uniref:HAT C-terminal dimerisation domain-containing protein n=1 Tax=Hevea brasiliensis TaxID=3981 RepID=A0A6A6LSB7_HEVBR|nr:hypothetical protein GH714_014154 [Hevea brasiliensis]
MRCCARIIQLVVRDRLDAVQVVLDPKYKLNYIKAKYIIYYFESEAKLLVDRVVNALKEMLNEYMSSNDQACMGDSGYGQNANVEKCVIAMMEEDEEIHDYFIQMEEQKLTSESEIDRYLEELSKKFTLDFDLLLWWKVNSVSYSVLSKVAKDVLAIQCSTVASESAFSTGGRTSD